MYARILITTDGSELAEKGLSKGLELAAQLGAQVDIVTVSEPWAVGMYDAMGWSAGYEASDEYKQDREDAAQKILQPALAAATAAGVANPKTHHVLDRYAADGMLELRGVSKPVTLTFTWTPGTQPVLAGKATVKRLDFGVGGGDWTDTKLIPDETVISTVVKLTAR